MLVLCNPWHLEWPRRLTQRGTIAAPGARMPIRRTRCSATRAARACPHSPLRARQLTGNRARGSASRSSRRTPALRSVRTPCPARQNLGLSRSRRFPVRQNQRTWGRRFNALPHCRRSNRSALLGFNIPRASRLALVKITARRHNRPRRGRRIDTAVQRPFPFARWWRERLSQAWQVRLSLSERDGIRSCRISRHRARIKHPSKVAARIPSRPGPSTGGRLRKGPFP